MNRKLILLFFIAVISFSCKNSAFLTPYEMKAYVEDESNGLIQRAAANDIEFTLKYKPLDLIAMQELSKAKVAKAELEPIKEKYNGLEYFTLNITSQKRKIGDIIQFDEKRGRQDSLASYIHFYMQRDFKMLYGLDTSYCVLYHLEQNGNITPYITISLAFEKKHSMEDEVKIIYNDKIFGAGDLIFRFSKENLENILATTAHNIPLQILP